MKVAYRTDDADDAVHADGADDAVHADGAVHADDAVHADGAMFQLPIFPFSSFKGSFDHGVHAAQFSVRLRRILQRGPRATTPPRPTVHPLIFMIFDCYRRLCLRLSKIMRLFISDPFLMLLVEISLARRNARSD